MHDLAASIPDPAPQLSISVISDRCLVRELVVTFLRQNGFPQALGSEAPPRAPGGRSRARGVVFVDLDNEHNDPHKLLHTLSTERRELTTIAIGTAIQLAAQAAEADAWIELSETSSRVTQLAALAGARNASIKMRASPKAERMLRTWQTLTRRQREVLALLGHGVGNQRLGQVLGISERAVKAHVGALLEKFKADSRTELALIAARAKLHTHAPGFSLSHLM